MPNDQPTLVSKRTKSADGYTFYFRRYMDGGGLLSITSSEDDAPHGHVMRFELNLTAEQCLHLLNVITESY